MEKRKMNTKYYKSVVFRKSDWLLVKEISVQKSKPITEIVRNAVYLYRNHILKTDINSSLSDISKKRGVNFE